MLKLYENIKNRRLELSMTQSELAEIMGYADKGMISRIESGKVDIAQSKILAFAKALNTTPSALMGWEADLERPAPKAFQEPFNNLSMPGGSGLQLSSSEASLLSDYRQLNQEGKEKVSEYAADLVASGRYIKSDPDGLVDRETKEA